MSLGALLHEAVWAHHDSTLDPHGSGVEVDVAPPQRHELAPSCAGCGREHHETASSGDDSTLPQHTGYVGSGGLP